MFNKHLASLVDHRDFTKEEIEKLHQFEQIKDALLWKVVVWYVVAPMTILLIFGSIFFVSRIDETIVSVDVKVSSVTIRTAEALFYDGALSKNSSVGKMTITGKLKLRYPSPDSVVSDVISLEPGQNGGEIEVSSFAVADSSVLKLQQILPGDLKILIEAKAPDPNQLNEPSEWKFAVKNVDLKKDGRSIYLFGNKNDSKSKLLRVETERSTSVSVELDSSKKFDFPILYAKAIKFDANAEEHEIKVAEQNKEQSSIISGKIKFLETKNDSLDLNMGDVLDLEFVDGPPQVKIQSDSSGIRLQFNAKVKKLTAGSTISKAVDLNRMPSRIKVYYNQESIFWAVLISIIPIVSSIIFGSKRQLR